MTKKYTDQYENFDADEARSAILGEDLHKLNVADLCCDRHIGHGKTAVVWRNADGEYEELTYDELKIRSERMASVLQDHGVSAGDRVAGLLPRIPELVVSIVAAWRIGAVYQPLFTAFGPKSIEHRLNISNAKVIVTDAANRAKITGASERRTIISVYPAGQSVPRGDVDYHAAVSAASQVILNRAVSSSDPFLMMFTSGTTGPAKALDVPVRALVAFAGYMRDAVGLESNDNFWNIADPGWAYGLYYGITGPLLLGHTTLLYDGPFSCDSATEIILTSKINVLAGSPTAFRLLMNGDKSVVSRLRGKLRAVSSAGEPLNPEVIRWFSKELNAMIFDHYGQTELGMVLCNYHALTHEVTCGSAGYPTPGIRMAVLNDAGVEVSDSEPGALAVDVEQSSMYWFEGYKGMPGKHLRGRYYLTGDSAVRSHNGSFKLISRMDDVITSSGYRIGPFDVENALLEHELVLEAAVIGKPDAVRTEVVKAFVVIDSNASDKDKLVEDLKLLVKKRLGAHAYPKEIEIVKELPKTPSGKIQRYVLRHGEIQ